MFLFKVDFQGTIPFPLNDVFFRCFISPREVILLPRGGVPRGASLRFILFLFTQYLLFMFFPDEQPSPGREGRCRLPVLDERI